MTPSCDLPRPAVALARRLCQIASEGDKLYNIQFAVIHGVWYLVIDDGKLEQLGKIDHNDKTMVR